VDFHCIEALRLYPVLGFSFAALVYEGQCFRGIWVELLLGNLWAMVRTIGDWLMDS
jgi:hypothetical protein